MISKSTTPTVVIELPLRIGSDVVNVLERTFSLGLCLHNATLGTVLKRDRELRASEAWAAAKAMPAGKERTTEFKRLMKDAGLTQSGFEKILNAHLIHSRRKNQIDSNTGSPTVFGLRTNGGDSRAPASPASRGEAAVCTRLKAKRIGPAFVGRPISRASNGSTALCRLSSIRMMTGLCGRSLIPPIR